MPILKLILITALAMMLSGISSANTYTIDTYVTGNNGSNPGSAVVATYSFEQNGANVDFRLDNSIFALGDLTNSISYISKFLFSYTGDKNLTNVDFTNFYGTQSVKSVTIDPKGSDASYIFIWILGAQHQIIRISLKMANILPGPLAMS